MQQTTEEDKNQGTNTVPIDRGKRRASMRDMNTKLVRDNEMLRRELTRLHRTNHAKDVFLLWICVIAGINDKEPNAKAVDILKARITELVELEKRVKGATA